MSESRVRENRMHGSMRRREATTASRASTRRAAEGASRRPYNVKLPAKLGIFPVSVDARRLALACPSSSWSIAGVQISERALSAA